MLDRLSQEVSMSNPVKKRLMFQLQLFWEAPKYALEECLPLCFRELLSIGPLLVGCSHGSTCAVGSISWLRCREKTARQVPRSLSSCQGGVCLVVNRTLENEETHTVGGV